MGVESAICGAYVQEGGYCGFWVKKVTLDFTTNWLANVVATLQTLRKNSTFGLAKISKLQQTRQKLTTAVDTTSRDDCKIYFIDVAQGRGGPRTRETREIR